MFHPAASRMISRSAETRALSGPFPSIPRRGLTGKPPVSRKAILETAIMLARLQAISRVKRHHKFQLARSRLEFGFAPLVGVFNPRTRKPPVSCKPVHRLGRFYPAMSCHVPKENVTIQLTKGCGPQMQQEGKGRGNIQDYGLGKKNVRCRDIRSKEPCRPKPPYRALPCLPD